MNAISNLIPSSPKEKDKHRSERGDLIDYFHNEVLDKSFRRYPIKRIAVLLGHLTVKDLYYMKSCFVDRMKRNGVEAAQKWFWYSLKVKK